MAQMYFYYSAMNAGKSTVLLQSNYNYHERGMRTLVFAPTVDDRFGKEKVASRIGLETAASGFGPEDDLYDQVAREHGESKVSCVLVDEAQFLTVAQVDQLADVCDRLGIPVLVYGLPRTFRAIYSPAVRGCWRWRTTCRRSRRSATAATRPPWCCGSGPMANQCQRAPRLRLAVMNVMCPSAAGTSRKASRLVIRWAGSEIGDEPSFAGHCLG